MPRFEVVSTPNPDSLKFEAKGFKFVENGMVTAARVGEAAGNPLAERLCVTEGVANVLMLAEFMTVTKNRHVSWEDLLPVIEKLIPEFYPEVRERRN